MPTNRAFDNYQPQTLTWPYNRVIRELSDEPRFVRGLNGYLSWSGKFAKRPGLIGDTAFIGEGYRIDRLWLYETLQNPPRIYLIASAFNFDTERWELWFQRRTEPLGTWTLMTEVRDCNQSTRPHEATPARGLFYVKSYPLSSGDKLGTISFDGTNETTNFWGLLGPQEPAHIAGAIDTTTADVNASTTTIPVVTTAGFPAAPFTIAVEFEQMTVTVVGATDFTVVRGVNNTVATEHPEGSSVVWRDFSASDHAVTVNWFWGYSYAYKTNTGHVSNRAPVETNPDINPSYTGPFQNLVPKITVQGHADTTRVPNILIFRTTDGGGTWFVLEEITNTGAGTITYLDDSLESGTGGGTFNDPQPDTALDTFNPAPSLISNSPPPANIAPEITGTDPVSPSTPLGYYSGRIWYGIGNILFYSAQEEITEGVPEEAFPSGTFGNFFRIQYPITNVMATADALYVGTLNGTFEVTGNNRETFSLRPLLENIGQPYGHPRAVTRFGNKICQLTNDFRIVIMEGDQVITMSDPLFTDIVDASNAGAEFDIKYWADLNNEWIVVAGHNVAAALQTRYWVLDVRRSGKEGFWFIPWSIPSSAMVSGRISEASGQRRLLIATWDSDSETNYLSRLDPTGRTAVDRTAYGENQPIPWYFDTYLMQNPAGNHLNALRMPNVNSIVYALYTDVTLFPEQVDPDVYYFFDDFWANPIEAPLVEPVTRRNPSTSYMTSQYNVNHVCQRFGFRMSGSLSTTNFELQNFYVAWNPEAGA